MEEKQIDIMSRNWSRDSNKVVKERPKKVSKHKVQKIIKKYKKEYKNIIYVTVEDPENKLEKIKDRIKEIKNIKLIKENEDKTKQYEIEAKDKTDLRKILFNELAKENITIFEMKKADVTLEDAFMKLIEGGNK